VGGFYVPVQGRPGCFGPHTGFQAGKEVTVKNDKIPFDNHTHI
jgi:hypothetical protein